MDLKERINYIGGSDCAGVLGLSRWATPLSVWAEKTGQIIPKDISNEPQIRWGKKMEPVIAEMWMEDTGKVLHRKNETIYHPKYPFIAANIDRRVVGEKAGWEAKYFTPYRSKEFDNDEFPSDCICQCQHYLAVTGWDRWYFVAALGNGEPVKRVVERDEKTISEIIKREVYFWNTFVIPKVMPALITKDDNDVLNELFPIAEVGKEIRLGDEVDARIEALQGYKEDLKNIESTIEKEENELKALIKENEFGITNNYRLSWKNRTTNRTDIKALKEAEPEIAKKYIKTTNSRVFDYKPLKVEEK